MSCRNENYKNISIKFGRGFDYYLNIYSSDSEPSDYKKIDIKFSDIKNNTGLSEYYIRKAINELISKNLISCKGKGKATRYYQTPSIIETVDMANQLTEIIRNYPSVKNQPQDKE